MRTPGFPASVVEMSGRFTDRTRAALCLPRKEVSRRYRL